MKTTRWLFNMDFLIKMFVSAGLIFILASLVPGIRVKSYPAAIWAFLLIGLLNATVGFFLRLPLNIVTLFLVCFVVRVAVSAVIIKITARLYHGFEVRNWSAALLLSVCLALLSSLLDKIL